MSENTVINDKNEHDRDLVGYGVIRGLSRSIIGTYPWELRMSNMNSQEKRENKGINLLREVMDR
jgi:hypothetical protein